jgi:hypothetical protein
MEFNSYAEVSSMAGDDFRFLCCCQIAHNLTQELAYFFNKTLLELFLFLLLCPEQLQRDLE